MEPKLTLQQAQAESRCRICGEPILLPSGAPVGWRSEFGRRVYPPPAIALDFGEEFAHVACLEKKS